MVIKVDELELKKKKFKACNNQNKFRIAIVPEKT